MERDGIAHQQQHREQRSLSLSMERWLADTGPFCASVKPEEKEVMALGGSLEGKEQNTVDHTKVQLDLRDRYIGSLVPSSAGAVSNLCQYRCRGLHPVVSADDLDTERQREEEWVETAKWII